MNKAKESHFDEKQLMHFLDGELSARERGRVESHLEACWSCRTRFEDLKAVVGEIVHFRNDALLPALPPPPDPWRGLDPQLDELDHRRKQRSVVAFLKQSIWSIPTGPRVSLVAATLLVVFFVFFIQSRQTVVTAAELLLRSEKAQASELDAVPTPVVHQKLRLKYRSAVSHRESESDYEYWQDRSHSRVRLVAAQPATIDELQKIYQANRFDWSMPLSATGFERWRQSLPSKKDRVDDESGLVTLTTTTSETAGESQVKRAQLVVRSSDWHPIEQRLWTEDQEFSISELQYEIVPLASLAASIFGEPPAPVPPAMTPPKPAKEVIAEAPLPNPTELAVAELHARLALHKVGADLGEPIEVAQTAPAEVDVVGLARSEKRKLELMQALQDIPHVAVRIQTVEEASRNAAPLAGELGHSATSQRTSGRSNSIAKAMPAEASKTEVLTPSLPIQSQLENYFIQHEGQGVSSGKSATGNSDEIQKEIEDLSSAAVKHSDGALSEAWALRRLAKRYSPEEISKLPPSSRRELEGLIRDHLKALHDQVNKMQVSLAPVLQSITAKSGGTPVQGYSAANSEKFIWPSFPWALFDEVNQADRLINSLFAAAGLPLEEETSSARGGALRIKSPEKCVADLLVSLARMDTQLPQIEKQVTGQFLENQ